MGKYKAKKKEQEVVEDNIITEYVTNKNGVKIKKCCASCRFKMPHDSEGPRRECTKHEKLVNKKDCCSEWEINEQIDIIKLR